MSFVEFVKEVMATLGVTNPILWNVLLSYVSRKPADWHEGRSALEITNFITEHYSGHAYEDVLSAVKTVQENS